MTWKISKFINSKVYDMKIFLASLFFLQIQARNRDSDRCYRQEPFSAPILRGRQFHGAEKISMSTCRNFCYQLRYVKILIIVLLSEILFYLQALGIVYMASMRQIFAFVVIHFHQETFNGILVNVATIASDLDRVKNVVDSHA